jgi:hypothetical protein
VFLLASEFLFIQSTDFLKRPLYNCNSHSYSSIALEAEVLAKWFDWPT